MAQIIITLIILFLELSSCQRLRTFPALFNAALERPITTTPAASTCGLSTRNAYCLSSITVDYVNRCIQGYCVETCPGRSQLPGASNMLIATSPGFGDCVLADTVNVRPGTPAGQFSTSIIRAGQLCSLSPSLSPRLDASGVSSFTVASWVWLDSNTKGTLLEKQGTNGTILFSLQVGPTGLTLLFGSPTEDTISVSMDVSITSRQWNHITLQVHDVSASVYVNGPGVNLSAAATVKLVSAVPDQDGSYRIGQNKEGNSQFIGKIQDLKFYSVALSNREIAQVYSGVFPPVRIQSECRCPGTYPRVKPGQTHYCIKNGDLPNTNDMTLRISRDAHPLEYANDGDSNSMWISNFQNEVEIDIDLGDQFQVFYVVMQFYSSFPKAVSISRQKNDTSSYEVWQYYADDCARFGLQNNGAFASPDSVNCLQFGTNGASIPYSQGNITFNLLAPDPVARPGSNDFYNTPELHEFVRAKKVRIKFQDHYYVTNIRHQYFAVYELIITAWCDCNGHASSCNTSSLPYTCNCLADSNTEGTRCERCKPLYNNKLFRKGDNLQDYPCQPCICSGHADSCVYNATLDPSPDSYDQGGGGVCINCQHFTTGRFCEVCLSNYYRPNGVSLYDPAVCQPCNCFSAGVRGGALDCTKVGGQCNCTTNVEGRRCDTCKNGFYGLSAANVDGCLPCNCNPLGVEGGDMSCNQITGQCRCKINVRGIHCDECLYGFYGLAGDNPVGCSPCNCNPFGSTSIYCDSTSGQCNCKDKVQGSKCDSCKDGFYNFTISCIPCSCNAQGTENGTVCDKVSGQCTCKRNVEGIYCDRCKEGTYLFGSSATFGCENCPCQVAGTVNGTGSCSTSGACLCKPNVEGLGCNRCKPSTWGLSGADPLGCQPCACDPTGTLIANLTVCDQNTGQCSCLTNRQGRQCDSCVRGFYINPAGGCLACSCHPTGTLTGTFCNSTSGQCECKTAEFGVSGKNCEQCLPTYYGFNVRNGQCTACNCLAAGSLNTTCNPTTGQCQCKQLVEGQGCDKCKAGSSQLDANNPYGCSTAPSQQPPPYYTNRTSNTITLRWDKPDYTNGVISGYNLFRNDTQVGNTSVTVMTFEDKNLQPFAYYRYVVEAVNAVGSTRSTPVVFQTMAGQPSNDMILNVTDVRARSALCTWKPPTNMNGPLLKYVILSHQGGSNTTVTEWEGTALTTTLTNLSPYARYTLIVRACTIGGCADNAGTQITTLSAPPEEQQPPNITALSSFDLLVSWQPPLKPNGVINFYELWFRGPSAINGPGTRIFHPSGRYDPLTPANQSALSPPATSYNVTGLSAFTTYEFQVLSENDAGKAASAWAAGRTLEAFPISLNPPTIIGISSSQLLITWTSPPPETMQGLVQFYRLYLSVQRNATLDPFGPPYVWSLVYEGGGTGLNYTINGLTPYSEHSFVLEACNGKGCVNSTAVTGRTLIAAPEGVQRPVADGFNTTAMEIKWKEPVFPNGPPPLYKIEKTNIALSAPASVIRGTRFTGGGYYAFPPSVIPQSVAFTGIRFRFRLERGTGLLLFMATNSQEEFLYLQFVNGRPRLMFDTQGCTNLAFVTTTNDEGLIYNDRKWHSFEARRMGVYGNVIVDEKWKGESQIRDAICQNTSIIGPTTAVYVGGVPPDFLIRRTDRSRRVDTTPLQGCIDSIEILQQLYPEELWTKLDWTQGVTSDLAFLNWQGCPINLEVGFHFMGKGYLVISNCDERACDVGGNTIHIRFRMRTSLHTGFLFLIYGGSKIFMYGALENGTLRFVISDSSVQTVVTYSDPSVNLCDGQWRLLSFDKIGQQASISVSQLPTKSVGDPNVNMSLTLTSRIYLGGLKQGSEAMQYVKDNGITISGEGFGGCFSGFQINDKQYDKDMFVMELANTNLDGCPPYYESVDTCGSSLITQVYQGYDTLAYDTGLLPYTDYIYRVVALNDAGAGYSSWGYGRTREGAPSGVNGPNSLRAISGNEIEVIWEEPDITYGLLTKFVVMAYALNQTGTYVSLDINDTTITAVNMTGVTPDTHYLVKIMACTPGGCTESENGMEVITPIEAPEDVPAPTAQSGSTYLFVQWAMPAKPNGPITGYFLYRDKTEIYNGGQLSYNVTDLQVYTAYMFYISACTSADCTDGPSVALSTSQLPPTTVGQPTLRVLDTTRIEATWEAPTILNGVLESYQLYASTVPAQLDEVVYNSSVLLPQYIIGNLTAGTTYFITLGACTGGGCTLGAPANATTEESAPEGVPVPEVVATSPNQLVVTWGAPQLPNGVIVRYGLEQNGVEVYSGLVQTYTANNLEPFSQHLFRVRACTNEGCAYSGDAEARTLEAAPQGIIVLNATVLDARTVNVTWSMPEKMNGNMTFRVYFSGLFYANPDSWNYSTITEQRSLLNTSVGYTMYSISPLVPMSNYSIQVNGSNLVGFILSNVVAVVMPPGTPDGMAPPDLISENSTSIKVTWRPVGRVNAPEVPAYLLQFLESTPNAIIKDEFVTVTLSYTKFNLQPFMEYKFRVIASNTYGQTLSPWASLVTKQDKPTTIGAPFISGVKARYMDIIWSAPLNPNGIISQYNIYTNGNLRINVLGNMTSLRVDNLTPYTYYTFEVEVCTVGGCTRSLPSATVRTLEDLPEQLALPDLSALTPSTVQINYKPPSKPNGVISQYIIERNVGNSNNVTMVTNRVPEMSKQYIDEANDLAPFSAYSYRVNVQNGAGTAQGPWAQVTTGSSRPAGVNPPQITSINPTAVLAKWSAPLQSNGQIETYVLRFPDPRIEIRNTTQLAIIVNDLKGYTNYSVTLTVCTSGGCTESTPTAFTTDSTIPAGQAAPSPVPVSQSRISILWQPPNAPNGPNIRYELSRMKTKQSLDNTVGDIGIWQSVYTGTNLFYEDTNLPMFTTYIYRVTVFNSIGQSTSSNSTPATTFGGLPRLPANVTAVALDHLSILVNWTLPAPQELQGEIQNLTLQATSPNDTKTEFPGATALSFVMGSLQANTQYSVTLTVTIFGGASITSQPVLVRTKDGAPSGLSPPQLSVVSNTALRVSWTAPAQPNGEIVAYRILMNERKIDTALKLPGSAVVDNLQPYTIYDTRIEACTVYACIISSSAFGTTAEALPQGLAAPIVTAISPTQVTVVWRPPDRPNGIIQRYDLWRKTLQSCSEIPAPTVNPEFEKCTYIECGILENLCRVTCYSGSKACCNGRIYDSLANYACCGSDYALKPGAGYICCNGQFYQPRTNYQCCGQRYIEVLPGEICCPDTTEDRVSISQGDSCCGSMPFLSTGAQMCCNNVLTNKFGSKCCGNRVISDTTVCCGNADKGQMFLQQPEYSCCGQDYVQTSITRCCVISTGSAKVHFYASEQEKLLASDKCCGLNLITANLGCCNYVGYNQQNQVCADRSRQDTGCGTGVVCPLSQQSTAYCNRCDFDTTKQTCGSVKGYNSTLPTTPDPNSTCTTHTDRIYSGLNLTFVDSSLSPYSQYEYAVVAVNRAGTTESSYAAVRTLEAVPEIVHPPSTKIAPGELYAIYLSWDLPEKQNGIITIYILKRDGIELYRGNDTNFTDNLNILPYRSYSYILSACNSAGCSDSSAVTVATAQAVPEDLLPPFVEVVNSTSIQVKAQLPGKPNGVVLFYNIRVKNLAGTFNSSAPQEFVVSGLTPYTAYTVDMVVCTVVGCSTSPNITVITNEALPEGLPAPRVIVISSTGIELYWRGPDFSNGVLKGFKLIQTQPSPVTEVYSGMNTSLRLFNLVPGQLYTYELEVSNGAGAIHSIPRQIIMPTVAPINVPPPQSVKALGPNSIQVQWLPLTADQGDIDQYRVFLNIGQETEVERGVGLQTRVTIPDLLAYTQYEVRLQACLRNVLNGCGTSSGVLVRTDEDIPQGMENPILTALASDAVFVEWQHPTNSNGVITSYKIFHRLPNMPESEILINQVPGSVFKFLHSGQDLKPYQLSEYKVIGVNSKGEASSGWVSIRTLESPPFGLSAPMINYVSTYGVALSWSPPLYPNGPIQEYRVFYQRNSSPFPASLEYIIVSGNVTNTSLGALEAYSSYILYLEAANDAGSVQSVSVNFTTREGYPAGLSEFSVEKINTGTAVILRWNIPQKPNGIITIYKVYDSASTVAVYSGTPQEFEFRRLSPYTEYSVKLEACTRVGCTAGKVQSFYTAEIPPAAQPSPTFGIVNATNVQLSWKPPVNPNGAITSYEVLRTSNSLRRKREIDVLSFDDSQICAGFVANLSTPLQFSSVLCNYKNKSELCLQKGYPYTQELSQNYETILQIYTAVNNLCDGNDMAGLRRVKRQSANPQIVYKTTDTGKDSYEYTDSGLKPNTQYQYSVRASNSQGYSDSPWQTVQTTQSTPEGVQPPQLSYIPNDINSINITWSSPTQPNGVLQSYQIQRNMTVPFSFPPDGQKQFVDSGLVAYTVYSYKLTACTGGGCTTSDWATIRTLEAAPLSVSPPTITAINSTSVKATWSKPVTSNGVITQYRLKIDGIIIYTGLQETYDVGSLVPYEKHTFTLTACTNGGCTESGEAVGRADDAPPTGLSPPLLRVLSSKAIEVTWSPPNNPNGIISSYDVRRDDRLIYMTTISVSGILVTSYIDYSLEPGIEYSYTIVATNRKGSMESGPARAMTYSDSPSGLSAPTLTPVSSTSIRVDWSPPSIPNGELTNYSVYQGTNRVYSGDPSQLSYTVPGLQYYTVYTFSVEACTNRGCEISQPTQARTLTAQPENQPAPVLLALGDQQGAHAGIRASWEGPVKSNGAIDYYELHRRDVVSVLNSGIGLNYGNSVLVYNGTNTTFTDNSTQLRPYRQYQYMVMSVNSVGKAGSQWVSVTTREAPPQGVLPPVINSTTASTITVTVQPPSVPNGVIKFYNILVNGTVASSSPSLLQQTVGSSPPLLPYTTYELKTEACTSGGCGQSPGIMAKTGSAKPLGLAAIKATAENNNSVDLAWSPPSNPNGQIMRYEVYKRLACPPTFQPFDQKCVVGAAENIYSGLDLTYKAGNLEPYRAYDFQVQAFNDNGGTDFPDWVKVETKASSPVYVQYPKLFKNGTLAIISWGSSFLLNGRLREYILLADGKIVFRGIATEYGVEREYKNQVITYIIQVITDTGQAESPAIVFDPNAVDNMGTSTTVPAAVQNASSTPFYQEIWFIVIMCLIALIILFIILALWIRFCTSRKPFMRERMPLYRQRHDKMVQGPYVISAADGSVIDGSEISPMRHRHSDRSYLAPGVGIVNPAFNGHLSPGRHSHKYMDDDDDDLRWSHPYDSGLFDSLDEDSTSGQSYSYTKEQTVFTDTHL